MGRHNTTSTTNDSSKQRIMEIQRMRIINGRRFKLYGIYNNPRTVYEITVRERRRGRYYYVKRYGDKIALYLTRPRR